MTVREVAIVVVLSIIFSSVVFSGGTMSYVVAGAFAGLLGVTMELGR